MLGASILDAMSHQATYTGRFREAASLARAALAGTRGTADRLGRCVASMAGRPGAIAGLSAGRRYSHRKGRRSPVPLDRGSLATR